jgi:hypothetical protein
MNTLGSHPGAILFRLIMMVFLILILIYVFLGYVEKAEKALEIQSIEQTRRIIDSALVVAFATHATNGKLDELDRLDGGNPFELLKEYLLLPASYHGETGLIDPGKLPGGWYYDSNSGDILFVPFYLPEIQVFRVTLSYVDSNNNGSFEAASDEFRGLSLQKKQPPY